MKKQNMICVAMTTWEGDYVKAVVKMMTELSTYANVLYVNYQFTWKDLITALLGKSNAPVKKILGVTDRIDHYPQKGEVFVLHPPPTLPINWIKNRKVHAFMNRINARIIGRSVRRAMKKLNMTSDIMINAFNPVLGVPLMDYVKASKTYYYCYDEISQSTWCKEHGPQYEKIFAEKVDAVFTTSTQLTEKLNERNSQVEWIPNGVDFNLFNQAFLHRKMAKVDNRICLIGSLDFRVDYDLLEFISSALPDVQFDLVGRVLEKDAANRLGEKINVHIHGAKSSEELLPYLSYASVGIIPFVKNEFTKNIYPLKINEYLAAGLPVVTTDFANLDDFKGIISYSTGHQEFLMAIKKYLSAPSEKEAAVRNEIARGNSWEKRAESLWNYHLQMALVS